MVDEPSAALIKLDDSDLALADPQDDVRGSKVLDRDGNEVGDVDGLVIDDKERRVRFLQVGSGGFLRIGQKKRLLPVDAIVRIEEDVHIDTSREHVADSAEYDPELVPEPDYYADLYTYYGYPPFWGPGYVYPALGHPFPYP